MTRYAYALAAVLTVLAVSGTATAADRGVIRTGTHSLDTLSSRGLDLRYSSSGDFHNWSVGFRGGGATLRRSFTSTGAPYGYLRYPWGLHSRTTIHDPNTGREYSFSRPWQYSLSRPRYHTWTFTDNETGRVITSTGRTKSFTRSFGPRRPMIANPRPPIAHQAAPAPRRASLDAGDELFAAGRYFEAAEVFEEVVAANANSGLAHFAYAHAKFATGEYSDAAEAIRTGVKLLPRWAEVPMDRRRFYSDQKDF